MSWLFAFLTKKQEGATNIMMFLGTALKIDTVLITDYTRAARGRVRSNHR
jgi:hypothetical protein